MRTVWTVAVLVVLALAAEAHADTVYLKDGQSIWGKEVTEDGDTVIVVRPGETLRFPKNDVNRIERWHLSVPRYYEPPSGAAAREGSAPAQSATPSAASTAEQTTPPQAPATAGPPSPTPPPGGATSPLAPTLLPPPPPPGAIRAQ